MRKQLLIFFIALPFLLVAQFTPGETYFGENEYIEYLAGSIPLIISAPHGGDLKPTDIPDRDCTGCVYVKDSFTEDLAREIAAAFRERTGCVPHVIINRLHRTKLDANRDIGDAADGDPQAEKAWEEFHEFIGAAKAHIATVNGGEGFFFDIHGHAHTKQRIELGYLLSADDLRMTDAELDAPDFYKKTSIVHYIENAWVGGPTSLSKVIRGGLILGGTFPAVPSFTDPFPLVGDPYFSGGYNTRRHGSRDSTTINAIQIECNRDIRFEESKRLEFAESVIEGFIGLYSGFYLHWGIPGCQRIGVSTNDIFDNIFEIYPNPTNDYFNLKSDEFPLEISIQDALGVRQKRVSVFHESEKINVSGLKAGMYFLSFYKKGERIGVQKLIIR